MSSNDPITDLDALLTAIDREIAFYRRRAGQVFFLSLLAEAFILTGRQKIEVPENPSWLGPFIYSIFFVAVAATGIALGREYRGRIHALKRKRNVAIELLDERFSYQPPGGITLSEIQMLYVALVFLSSSGILLVWIKTISENTNVDTTFLLLRYAFTISGTVVSVISILIVLWWLVKGHVGDFLRRLFFLERSCPVRQLLGGVLWLDFGNDGSDRFLELLEETGFSRESDEGPLQIWRPRKKSCITLEILTLDAELKDPVTNLPGFHASEIDKDRRRLCSPKQMDPLYRCMLVFDYVNAVVDNNTVINAVAAVVELRRVVEKAGACYFWQYDEDALLN